MKIKRKLGFTLVEMLIVVVIIGILASALLPRLTTAQGRARDTARKADLAQIGTALIEYIIDAGVLPNATPTFEATAALSGSLRKLGFQMPKDGIADRAITNVFAVGTTPTPTSANGSYGYIKTKKNRVSNVGFFLVAATETRGGANRVATGYSLTVNTDSTTFTTCDSIGETTANSHTRCTFGSTASDLDAYRYFYKY